MIEVLHTQEHYNQETGDAHGYCGRKEWVKKLQEDQLSSKEIYFEPFLVGIFP